MKDEMSQEERRGKKIALAIAIIVSVLAALDFLALFLTATSGSGAGSWFGLVLRLAMAWLIYRGYGWARSYLAFLLVVNALIAAVGLPLQLGDLGSVVALPVAAIYFAFSWAVWRSKALEAYCAHQYRKRNPSMSMSNHLGV